MRNFDGTSISINGAGLITRILHNVCDSQNTSEMTRERCKHFEVLPQNVFYAVSCSDWKRLFDPGHAAEVARITKDSISVQFWNTHSSDHRILMGPGNTAIELMAREFCPNVYLTYEEDF